MSIFLFAQKVYVLSKSWGTYRHVDQREFLCGQSTKTYVCTYVQKHPKLAWWQVSGTDDDCGGFTGRCSIISSGGLWFCSSLWPPTIASSCWTGLPKVGSSSRWSRGTSGGPSTVSSSLPDSRTERLKHRRRIRRRSWSDEWDERAGDEGCETQRGERWSHRRGAMTDRRNDKY